MKKLFCLNLVVITLVFCFVFSVSAAILPPSSRAFTGRITKIFKDKSKKDVLIKVQTKNKSIIVHVPHQDPQDIIEKVKKYSGKLVMVIYSYPDMAIINIIKQERKKQKKF